MAKSNITKYLWTEKAAKLFGNKGAVPGEEPSFMGRPVTEKNLIDSWLRHGYVVKAKEHEV